MLTFVQSFFAPKANPIGIDFGSDAIRMAQVRRVGSEFQLIAAATTDVPSHVRNDASARLAFFAEAVREMLAHGGFTGRQAVLALPAAAMFIQHLRMGKMDEEALKKAIPWEARGKLPIDPTHAILRHHIAGEIYQEQEPRQEVVVMAASREYVNQLLAAAGRGRLDVVGMEVEPKALVDCFSQVYRRKNDADVTNLLVDIGSVGSRAVVVRGGHILFARTIPIGGEHLNRAAAAAMSLPLEEAKLMRIQTAQAVNAPVNPAAAALDAVAAEAEEERLAEAAESRSMENSFALLGAAMAASSAASAPAPGGVETSVPERRTTGQAIRNWRWTKRGSERGLCRAMG